MAAGVLGLRQQRSKHEGFSYSLVKGAYTEYAVHGAARAWRPGLGARAPARRWPGVPQQPPHACTRARWVGVPQQPAHAQSTHARTHACMYARAGTRVAPDTRTNSTLYEGASGPDVLAGLVTREFPETSCLVDAVNALAAEAAAAAAAAGAPLALGRASGATDQVSVEQVSVDNA